MNILITYPYFSFMKKRFSQIATGTNFIVYVNKTRNKRNITIPERIAAKIADP